MPTWFQSKQNSVAINRGWGHCDLTISSGRMFTLWTGMRLLMLSQALDSEPAPWASPLPLHWVPLQRICFQMQGRKRDWNSDLFHISLSVTIPSVHWIKPSSILALLYLQTTNIKTLSFLLQHHMMPSGYLWFVVAPPVHHHHWSTDQLSASWLRPILITFVSNLNMWSYFQNALHFHTNKLS